MYNPQFNYLESEVIEQEAGLNSFVLTPKRCNKTKISKVAPTTKVMVKKSTFDDYMEENKSVAKAMEETISSEHLIAVEDIGEVLIDTTLNDGLLKDIPVISSIVGARKLITNIRDYLFVNKLISFLFPIKDTNAKERIEAIKKWEKDSKYRINVGESLLGMIDRCDNRIKAEWLSRLFYELVLKRQWSDLFMRAEKILSSISVMDMQYFLNFKQDQYSQIDADLSEPFLGTGLYKNAALVWKEANDERSGYLCEVSEVGNWIYHILKGIEMNSDVVE